MVGGLVFLGLVTLGWFVPWVWFWVGANIFCVIGCLHTLDIKSHNFFGVAVAYAYTLSMIVIKADKAGRDHVWDFMRSAGLL